MERAGGVVSCACRGGASTASPVTCVDNGGGGWGAGGVLLQDRPGPVCHPGNDAQGRMMSTLPGRTGDAPASTPFIPILKTTRTWGSGAAASRAAGARAGLRTAEQTSGTIKGVALQVGLPGHHRPLQAEGATERCCARTTSCGAEFVRAHCTALHCTALHCTALHCSALLCSALHCTALHCTAQCCGPSRQPALTERMSRRVVLPHWH